MTSLRLGMVLCLLGAATTARAELPLLQRATKEAAIDAPVLASSATYQDFGSLAFGGGVYLAVWRDYGDGTYSILAARLNKADGSPIDGKPIVLAPPTVVTVDDTCVAFDGTRFFVSWHTGGATVEGRYIDPATGAIGTQQLHLTSTFGLNACAASDGTTVLAHQLVLPSGLTNVVANVFTAANLPGQQLTLSTVNGSSTYAVAAGASGFLPVWIEDHTTFTLLQSSLVTGGATPSATPAVTVGMAGDRPSQPAVSYAPGSGYAVVWREARGAVRGEIYARMVTEAGVPTGAESVVQTVSTTTPTVGYSRPIVNYVNANHMVVWESVDATNDVYDLLGARVSVSASSLALVEPAAPVVDRHIVNAGVLPSSSRPQVLASTGSSARFAWVNPSISLTRFDLLTTPIGGGPPSPAPSLNAAQAENAETGAALAFNGDVYLAVWEDGRNVDLAPLRGSDLMAQRFDRSGAPLGPAVPLITEDGNQRFPSVAGLPGGDFLVAWVDDREPAGLGLIPYDNYYVFYDAPIGRVYYTRVNPATATSRDPSAIAVPWSPGMSAQEPNMSFPIVTAGVDDKSWLLTWQEKDPMLGAQAQLVNTSVISGSGAMSGGMQIKDATPLCATSVARSGSRFFVVLETNCKSLRNANDLSNSDLFGQWVDATGADANLPHVTIANRSDIPETAGRAATRADGSIGLVWQEKQGTTGSLHTAILNPPSQLVVQPAFTSPTLQPVWPRLTAIGRGFLLTFSDDGATPAVDRMVRLLPDGTVFSGDLPSGTFQSAAAASSLPSFRYFEYQDPSGDVIYPERLGTDVIAGPDGQILTASTVKVTSGVPRIYTRTLQARLSGDSCSRASQPSGVGCADGRCERDAEGTGETAGLCCATECSGPCQKCTVDGCVGTPTGDPLCGIISCKALDTTCRKFADAPGACGAFGVCGSASDLSTCAKFTSAPDGTACDAPGCKSAGGCAAGECVCPDGALPAGLARTLPTGCSASGHGATPPFALLLVVTLLLLARRRTWLFLSSLLLLGCGNDPNALQLDLQLDDALLRETAFVRIVIEPKDGTLPAAPATMTGRSDELIRNVDLLGNGKRAIVADLEQTFPFLRKTTYLKVVPSDKAMREVNISAQAINRFGNPVSAVRGVGARLPGDTLQLHLSCALDCTGVTSSALTVRNDIDPDHHPIDALASAPGFLIVGVGLAGPGKTLPTRGLIALLPPDATTLALANAAVSLDGEHQGDRLGSSLLVGDVDGDGQLDLVAGAPGFGTSAGRVYVLYGPIGASLGIADARNAVLDGAPGELLGSSLALIDVDGDGKLEIVAGAPGLDPSAGTADLSAGSVYLWSGVTPGAKAATSSVKRAAGRQSGAHLGRAVSARDGLVAAGAPGGKAVHLLDPLVDFGLAPPAPRSVWSSTLPGFGEQVAVIDLDADGKLEVAASSPIEGAGVLIIEAPTDAKMLGDGDIVHVARAVPAGTNLGVRLQRIASSFGDHLAAIAARGAQGTAGGAFLLSGSSFAAAGQQMPLSFGNEPNVVSAAVTATLGDAHLTALWSADLLSEDGTELFFGDDQGRVFVLSPGGAL